MKFEVVNFLEDVSQTSLTACGYDVVLDVAVFHAFTDQHRIPYMNNLGKLIKPGGLYIQIAFSEKEETSFGPRRIRKSDLEKLFSSENGWRIESIEDTIYESQIGGPMVPQGKAYLMIARRK